MTIKLCLDLRRQKADNTYPIIIYIRNISSFRVSTVMSANLDNWDMHENKFNRKEKGYKLKNIRLKDLMDRIHKSISDAEETVSVLPDNRVKTIVRNIVLPEEKREKPKTFVDYIDEFIGQKENESKRVMYRITKSKILSFDKSCTFETINY